MIRVPSQSIGGRAVTPIVDLSSGILRVFLNVAVGSGRLGRTEDLFGDTIDLRVVDADGHELRPTTRPEPGPLPVEGSRALLATAEFVFRTTRRPKLVRIIIGKDAAEFRL